MGIRDWLAIIVIVFIVLILLDGFRRKWLERKNRIRVKLEKNIPAEDVEDVNDVIVKSELPNGGARIKTRAGEEVPVLVDSVDIDDEDIAGYADSVPDETDDDLNDEAHHNDGTWQAPGEDFATAIVDEDDSEAEFSDEDDFDEQDDPADEDEDSFMADDEGEYGDEVDDEDEQEDDSWRDFDPVSTKTEEPEPVAASNQQKDQQKGQQKEKKRKTRPDERIEPTFGDDDMTFGRDDQGELNLEHHDLFEHEDEEPAEESDEQAQAEEVIIINVMARPGMVIEGKRMLPVLMKHGMRLGDMSIFHRHADNNGKGPVMFSMANMLRPGTFSIGEMESFTTPGVSFFMQLPNKVGNMQCFDQMLQTAQAVKEELDANLKDENRSVLTRQTIEHSRQRIRDFELEMLARK